MTSRQPKQDDASVDWWKVCNHPLVQGLHRLITLVAVPVGLALLFWGASTFDTMRLEFQGLKTTVTIKIDQLERNDNAIDRRLTYLEQDR